MDEYTSEILIVVVHNTSEDSHLAAPIILDLVLLAMLSTRIQLKVEGKFHYFHPVATILSYLTKAPLGYELLHQMEPYMHQVVLLPPEKTVEGTQA